MSATHARFIAGSVTELYSGGTIVIDGQQHPGNILKIWSVAELTTLDIVKVTRDAKPAFNPATQKLVLDPVEIGDSDINETWSVVALSQGELDSKDQSAITSAVLDMGFILVKLVDKLISQGTISANDFDADTKAEYVALKARVNKLRP